MRLRRRKIFSAAISNQLEAELPVDEVLHYGEAGIDRRLCGHDGHSLGRSEDRGRRDLLLVQKNVRLGLGDLPPPQSRR